MRAVTHLAFAGLTGVIAAGFGANPNTTGSAALALGALLPDIDTTHSGVGKWVKPLSSRLERRFGHRTITHSLLGTLILALLTSWLIPLHANIFWWLLIGYLSHLILDTANIIGVPLLYPLRLQFWMVHKRNWRVPYSSPKEFTWLGCITLTTLALMPLSIDGFGPWFHRALGTPYGAVEDYLMWRNNYEVWADITGTNLISNEDINGRYQIIDVLNTETLLIEDETGKAYSVGLGDQSNISSKKIQAWRGQKITSSTYRVDLTGRLVSDLINSLPKGAQSVHLNASLTLNNYEDIPRAIGYFERIKNSGNKLELRSATIGDLAPLASHVIKSGSAIIRAEYSPGSEALATLSIANSTPNFKSHVLSIPNLPSLAGLTIDTGDEVQEGELIARYIDDKKLNQSQTQIEETKTQLPQLETQQQNELKEHQLKLQALEQTQQETKEQLERTHYLVSKGAEPPNQLSQAQHNLNKAENAVLLEKTRWTTRQNELQTQLRQAQLTLAKAEQAQQTEMQNQWVKAPITGLISDIRLTGITTKGINIEVMILEQQDTQTSLNTREK